MTTKPDLLPPPPCPRKGCGITGVRVGNGGVVCSRCGTYTTLPNGHPNKVATVESPPVETPPWSGPFFGLGASAA